MDDKDVNHYCNVMEEIKLRVEVIRHILAGHQGTIYNKAQIEQVYLQFRKILELIAFASIATNRKIVTEVYGKISKLWNANDMFKILSDVHPGFYPEPVEEIPPEIQMAKSGLEKKKNGYLTKDEFITLYGKCGNILHATNPYGKVIDYNTYLEESPLWLSKIMQLLNLHLMRLLNDQTIYLIQMQCVEDGKVHHYTFKYVGKTEDFKA